MTYRGQKTIRCVLLLLTMASIGGWSHTARAQAIYGSIYGQVTDTTGASIPNASITVTDESKGTSVQVTASQSGEYLVPHLIPDVYDVEASAPGFRSAVNKSIQVSADTSPKIDLKLAVGSSTETVSVTSEAPQLQTDRAEVSTEFDEKTVYDLPNQGRNFGNLELLIPGVSSIGYSQSTAEDPQGSPQYQIQGQAFGGVDYELDGAVDQDPILGQIVINPPLDAVTEAKILTQSFDAEFGSSIAAVVTAQTKSGTNKIHGDVFDYRTSGANAARDPYFPDVPYSPLSNRLTPPALDSQFGGSVGGPILKDKAFYFGDYQGTRQKLGAFELATVPTNLIRNSCLSGNGCDLSEFLTARGPQSGQIYNPRVVDPTTGAAAPFANNFIPNQYISPQALYLLKLIPAPNATGNQDGTSNNYDGGGNGYVNQNQYDARVDYQLRPSVHAFGRYSYFANANGAGTVFGPAGGAGFGYGGSAIGRNQSAVTGMDIALSPKLLTDFRLGYLRYHVSTHKFDGTTDLATEAGIPGLNLGDSFTAGSPAFYVGQYFADGLSSFGSGLYVNGCNCPLVETEDQYQIVNNWTKLIGNHSIKFGEDLRYARNLRVPSDVNRAGELSFYSSDTENQTLSNPGGIALATFLLGDVSNFARYVSTSTNAKESQKRIFSYVQDSWRVTPNLTVNFGLRWEIYFPETVNGKGQGGFADLNLGAIRVAGYGPYNTEENVKNTYTNFAPRIGVAYQPDPKSVVRAGYGRSFAIGMFGSIFGHLTTQNVPVLGNQDLTNAGANSSVFNLSTGPPAFVFPTVPASGLIPIPNGLSSSFRHDPNQFPTVDGWNLSLQHQFTKSLAATLAYVGSKGTHNFAGTGTGTNANEAAACLPASESITGQTLCFNPNAPNGSLTETNDPQLLDLYYKRFGWTQYQGYAHLGFDTHYNALQANVEKRFSNGFQFTGRYTWQRGFNYGNDYAEIDKKVNYGRNDNLQEQEFQLYGNYQLPFGKSRQFLKSVPRWVDYLIGGYQLSPSLIWESGSPFTPSYGECGADIPDGPCMPSKAVGRLPLHVGKFDPTTLSRTYFTPVSTLADNGSVSGPFLRPNIDQFGNVGRNNYFGPWFFNTDAALSKDIPIRESVRAQFRVNAFNVFNYQSPAPPGNTCIDCQGAGTINGLAGTPRQLQFALSVFF
jgi:outer membrane receptor protein involved in Fe transport